MKLAGGIAQSTSLSSCFSSPLNYGSHLRPVNFSSLWILPCLSSNYRRYSLNFRGKKKDSFFRYVSKEHTMREQEAEMSEEEAGEAAEELKEDTAEEEYIEGFGDDFEDEFLAEDEDEDEDEDPHFGDGGGGGGISLTGTWWDKEALSIAEEVSLSFNGELKIYAFKTSNFGIRVRIEKMSNKYGSPTIDDIEAFSSAYRKRLDEAERVGTIPIDISLEVSSPGVERVVRVPEELKRFKDKPMYVKYATMDSETSNFQEADGIFSLVSFDLEASHCTWSIADVKVNRQKAGKGRPLSKKQRQWRLETPFDSLRLVRVHSDC